MTTTTEKKRESKFVCVWNYINMRIKSFFFCLHHQILSRRAIFYPWPLKEREGVPLFRLYAVLGTTRPSAIEDKFNFVVDPLTRTG